MVCSLDQNVEIGISSLGWSEGEDLESGIVEKRMILEKFYGFCYQRQKREKFKFFYNFLWVKLEYQWFI